MQPGIGGTVYGLPGERKPRRAAEASFPSPEKASGTNPSAGAADLLPGLSGIPDQSGSVMDNQEKERTNE